MDGSNGHKAAILCTGERDLLNSLGLTGKQTCIGLHCTSGRKEYGVVELMEAEDVEVRILASRGCISRADSRAECVPVF